MAIFDRFRKPDTEKAPSIPAGTIQLTDGQIAALMSQNPSSGQTANALERNPLDYTVPFAPGRPLIPALINPPREDGRATPRRSEFPVAWNIQITQQRSVPFETLRAVSEYADIVRKCIEFVKATVSAMEWDISLTSDAVERQMAASGGTGHAAAAKKAREQLMPEITKAKDFWRMPDRINGLSFPEWIGMALEEVLVIDALSIYPNRTLDNENLHSLEILDGTTIKPLLDDRGARPTPPHAAFQQILWGFPRGEYTASADSDGEFTADDLVYLPRIRRPFTPYGLSAVERALPLVDLYMKRLQWLRTEFTDGVTPDVLIKTDATYGNNPEILRGYEQVFNDALSGNIEQRRRARLLPQGMEPVFSPGWDTKYKSDFDEWLLKAICGHFGVLPSQIGFTPKSGLGGAGHQDGEQASYEDGGLRPLIVWFTDVLNQLSYRFLNMPKDLTFVLSDGSEEDETAQAQRLQIQVSGGLKTFNEARSELGLPLYSFPEADMPVVSSGAMLTPISTGAITDEDGVIQNETQEETVEPDDKQNTPEETTADKELAAFIRWTKSARKREFVFNAVTPELAKQLNTLAQTSPDKAREHAIQQKAGGTRPKARRGREPFPSQHPARKKSEALARIYQKRFLTLSGGVNPQAIAEAWASSNHPDPKHWLHARGVKPFGHSATRWLIDLYHEAGWMGTASAKTLMKQKGWKVKAAGDLSTDWDNWTPGNAEVAAKLLGEKGTGAGLKELIRDAQVTIDGIANTRMNQLGTILGTSASEGWSVKETANAIESLLRNPERAELIASTELNRANNAAAKDEYKDAGMTHVDWQTAGAGDVEVCEDCFENEANNPWLIDEVPECPEHPNCGCQIVPVEYVLEEDGLADVAPDDSETMEAAPSDMADEFEWVNETEYKPDWNEDEMPTLSTPAGFPDEMFEGIEIPAFEPQYAVESEVVKPPADRDQQLRELSGKTQPEMTEMMDRHYLKEGFLTTEGRGSVIKQGEKTALNSYTQNAYKEINGLLRGRETYTSMPEYAQNSIKAKIDKLNSLIGKAPGLPEDVLTFRGFRGDVLIDQIRTLEVGDIWVEKGFVSTSIRESVARSFAGADGAIFEIANPAGTQGAWVNGVIQNARFSAEAEWLLKSGAKFEVLEIKPRIADKPLRIRVKVLP